MLKNSINKIDLNAFNNSNSKKIILSIQNISSENICNLKYSLKPTVTKTFDNKIYYDSIYIENRVDLNCEKTLSFMKTKIFYNFLFESDMFNFLSDCKDLKRLKNSIKNYDCNNYKNNSKDTNIVNKSS